MSQFPITAGRSHVLLFCSGTFLVRSRNTQKMASALGLWQGWGHCPGHFGEREEGKFGGLTQVETATVQNNLLLPGRSQENR